MLKKLLVLSLVLGLAGVANASLSLTLGGSPAPDEVTIVVCQNVVIDVSSNNTDAYQAFLELLTLDTGEWAGGMTIIRPGAGGSANYIKDTAGYIGTWELRGEDLAQTSPVVAGTHFEILFHCKAEGDVVINLYDSTFTYPVLDTITIHQIVPEPMTIALLGLGGLFLRRRK
jgi:hypothetical protein